MATGESERGYGAPPAVGDYIRPIGKLVAIEDVTPPVERVIDYIFESVSARCELRFRGEVVKDIQTLSDFYGEGTGVATAIKEMEKYAADKKIGPASEIEVVVVRVSGQCRMRPTTGGKYQPLFSPIDYGCLRDLPNPVETIVWSSKGPTGS
jgi:hypothetical protein